MKKKQRDKPIIRQKVTNACCGCRKRRSKCSGPPVCLRCKQNNLVCEFISSGKRGPPKGVPKKNISKNDRTNIVQTTQNLEMTDITPNSIIPPHQSLQYSPSISYEAGYTYLYTRNNHELIKLDISTIRLYNPNST